MVKTFRGIAVTFFLLPCRWHGRPVVAGRASTASAEAPARGRREMSRRRLLSGVKSEAPLDFAVAIKESRDV